MEKQKKIILFFIGTLLFNIVANLAHPVTPTIIKNLNLADYMFGAAYGTMMFGNFLFSPFWGNRNEYTNSRSTMAVCCTGYAIGQILFSISKTEIIILFARLFSGVFAGGIFVSFLTYLIRVSKEEERGRNLAVLAAGGSVAGAFGYFIGGMLGEISVSVVFDVQAVGLFLCGILFLLVCEKDRREENKRPDFKSLLHTANPFAAFGSARRFMNRRFFLLFSICTLSYLGFTAFEQCFNYYIKDVYELTSGYNGTIKAAIGIASLLANGTLCMYIIKKTKIEKSTVIILTACAVSIFAVILSKDMRLFIAASVLFFAINAVSIPVIQELVSCEAKEEDRGIVMGFYNGMKSFGGIIGALAAGAIYTFSPLLPIIFSGIIFILASVISFFFMIYQKR